MTMQDVRPVAGGPYDVELLDPVVEPDLRVADLGRFQHLSETERRRVIIRVLCGLVAMEEAVAAAAEAAPEPPDPMRRRLPFLGLEIGGAHKLRPAASPTASLLPYLGTDTTDRREAS